MKSGRLLPTFALLVWVCLAGRAQTATRFVNLNNPSPAPPYTNWPSAATNIQDAIDASSSGDVVLVTNGLYQTGSRTASVDSTPCRVVINKSVTVRSVNGSSATVIEGFSQPGAFPWSLSSVRCAYVTNGASLTGFTLTNGSVIATSYVNLADLGGAAYCESSAVLSNCVLINCAAYAGGGASGGTLFHCLVTNCLAHIGGGGVESGNLDCCEVVWNTSDYYAGGLYLCQATNCNISYNLGLFGGGAFGGTISQCTVFGNYAPTSPGLGGGYGGGLDNVDAKNSIIYYNVAQAGGDDTVTGTFTNCCASDVPAGSGNITNAPLFIDSVDFPGNLHLQTNSPCINAGNSAFVSDPLDLDGRPRLVGPKVDMGAYESQGGDTNSFLVWLWTYQLPTDFSSDLADPDGDGLNNRQEWRAGTDPTNALSVLKMLSLSRNASGITVGWQSVTNVTYYLQRSANPAMPTSFSTIKSNLSGQAGITTSKDATATSAGPFFYRVGVQ